jgi:hypothetical protein
MANQETLATLGTQDTGRRQTNQINSTEHRKLKRMSNTNPINVKKIFRNKIH